MLHWQPIDNPTAERYRTNESNTRQISIIFDVDIASLSLRVINSTSYQGVVLGTV